MSRKINLIFNNKTYQDIPIHRYVKSGVSKNIKLAVIIELLCNVKRKHMIEGLDNPELEDFLWQAKAALTSSNASYYDAHKEMNWMEKDLDVFHLYGFPGIDPDLTEKFIKILLRIEKEKQ